MLYMTGYICFSYMLVVRKEFIGTIREIQKVSNPTIDVYIRNVVYQFDHNQHGLIKVDQVLQLKSQWFLFA